MAAPDVRKVAYVFLYQCTVFACCYHLRVADQYSIAEYPNPGQCNIFTVGSPGHETNQTDGSQWLHWSYGVLVWVWRVTWWWDGGGRDGGWIFVMDARTKASTCAAHDRGRLHSALSVGLSVWRSNSTHQYLWEKCHIPSGSWRNITLW